MRLFLDAHVSGRMVARALRGTATTCERPTRRGSWRG